MIKSIKMFTVLCDNCGADSNEGTEYSCHQEPELAKDVAIDADWEIMDDGKHICTNCYKGLDENDNPIIDFTRQSLLATREKKEDYIDHYEELRLTIDEKMNEIERLNSIIKDYEEMEEDKKRLVREMDEILNGKEGMAKQASLCDIVSQIAEIKKEHKAKIDISKNQLLLDFANWLCIKEYANIPNTMIAEYIIKKNTD